MFGALICATAIAGAVLLGTLAVVQYRRERARERTFALMEQFSGTPIAVPAGSLDKGGRVLRTVAPMLAPAASRRRMRRTLAQAGRDDVRSLDLMIGNKVAGLAFGTAAGVVIGLLAGGWWWAAVPAMGALGFWWPDLRLRDAVDRRTTQIERALPDALDLLQLCVASGLSLQGALAEVSRTQDSPVAAEFRRVLQEMRLGVSRSDAFLALTRRSRQQDLLRFAHAMIQVDRLGIPVRVVLAEQARDMRERRRVRARERAQQVSVRILLPLVVCFLPALFVVVLGPALLSIVRSFAG